MPEIFIGTSEIYSLYPIKVIELVGYALGSPTVLVSRRVKFRDISCHFRGVIPLTACLFLRAHIVNCTLKEPLIMISIRRAQMIDK